MRETRRSGLRVRYECVGSGPPLVLVHGYTASGWSNWSASGWVDFLAPQYTLLIPDLRGHGWSQKPWRNDAYTIQKLARDVRAVLREEDVAAAPVLGYSMGGMVALELLARHPDLVPVGIVGGMGSYYPPGRGRFALERQQPGSHAPRRTLPQAAAFIAGYAVRLDPVALNCVYNGLFRTTPPIAPEAIDAIRQPVLVAAGELDVFHAPAEALARALPNARFLSLSEEGHLSAMRDPRFMAAAAQFLAETWCGPAVA